MALTTPTQRSWLVRFLNELEPSSRKFIAFLLGVIIGAGNHLLSFNLSDLAMGELQLFILAYIGQSTWKELRAGGRVGMIASLLPTPAPAEPAPVAAPVEAKP